MALKKNLDFDPDQNPSSGQNPDQDPDRDLNPDPDQNLIPNPNKVGRPFCPKNDIYHQYYPAWKKMIDSLKGDYEPIYQPWLDYRGFARWAKDQDNAWAVYPDGPIDFRMKFPAGGWFPDNCHFVRMSYEEREKKANRKRLR